MSNVAYQRAGDPWIPQYVVRHSKAIIMLAIFLMWLKVTVTARNVLVIHVYIFNIIAKASNNNLLIYSIAYTAEKQCRPDRLQDRLQQYVFTVFENPIMAIRMFSSSYIWACCFYWGNSIILHIGCSSCSCTLAIHSAVLPVLDKSIWSVLKMSWHLPFYFFNMAHITLHNVASIGFCSES